MPFEESLGLVPSGDRVRDLAPSRSRNHSDSDEDRDDTPLASGGEHDGGNPFPLWRHGVLAVIVVVSAIFCIVAITCSEPILPISVTHAAGTIRHPSPSATSSTVLKDDVLGLLNSRALQEAVANAAVKLGEMSATLYQHQSANASTSVMQHVVKTAKLPPSETKRIRREAQHQLKETLRSFFDVHAQAATLLTSIGVSAEHVADTLSMLKALTDPRILSVGMKAIKGCAEQSMSHGSLGRCLQQQGAAQEPLLRQLRKELLPVTLQSNTMASFRHYHLEMLRTGAFRASSDANGWHAELEVSSRSLQSMNPFSSSPVFSPTAKTPINWFTIGAPVISNMLGLVFLSLMALLPGTGGFTTNRAANYALWGIQGAVTVGECLANIGAVYFASCIIDVLFTGLEVIWVFFDGRRVSGPRRQVRCSSYSQWPALRGVCGNCMALVAASQFQNRCDVFCGTFGHRAEFAARAVQGSCFPQARYGNGERIPFDVILCQCVLSARQLARATNQKHAFIPRMVQANWYQLEHMRYPLPDLLLPEGRRLQASSECVHDLPYFVQIFTSTQPEANGFSPVVSLVVAGVQIRISSLSPAQANLGQMVQSTPLFIPQRPERLVLQGLGDAYGYRRIVLVRGAENTIVLDSLNGAPLGRNQYWVRAPRVTSRIFLSIPTTQRFDIPAIGNFSSTTSTTTGSTRPESFALEFVTSGQPQSQSSGTFAVDAIFNNGTRQVRVLVLPNNATRTVFECRAVRLNMIGRPGNFTLQASGSRGEWSYSSIYIVDNAGSAPVASSVNGVGRSLSNFWIGTSSTVLRSRQVFTIPQVTGTTITATTTTRQQCVHDEPYVITIITSNQIGADGEVADFRILLDGRFERSDFVPKNPGLGQPAQTRLLFLPQRPSRLRLLAAGRLYGYRRIVMVRGAETTTILDSDTEVPIGNNSYWLSRSNNTLRAVQEFEIPQVGNFTSTTSSTTRAASRSLDTFTLEIVTSGQPGAQFSSIGLVPRGSPSMVVDVVFDVPTATGNQQVAGLFVQGRTPPDLWGCNAVSFNSAYRPVNLTLVASFNSQLWGYRSIYFTDSNGTVAVLDSSFGEPAGLNDFWVGTTPRVRRLQTFQIPAITTSTTTTTTATVTTFTGSTSTLTTSTFTATSIAPQALQCLPYSSWPNILGLICGNCEALVATAPYNGSCEQYCSSFGQVCVTAWDDIDGTCSRRNQVDCSMPVPNAGRGMLCTCRSDTTAIISQQCQSYAQWPQINVNVCGGCKAAVSLGVPTVTQSDSCSHYCQSFDHRCTAAAHQGSMACSIGQPLSCQERVEGAVPTLCTCQQSI